jgi:hypothetical protein
MKIMWHKEYRDYPTDTPLIKNQVSPSHGIVGCEMHDVNGWNIEYHIPAKRPSKFATFLSRIFSRGSK